LVTVLVATQVGRGARACWRMGQYQQECIRERPFTEICRG
jgi:hypothetical protein